MNDTGQSATDAAGANAPPKTVTVTFISNGMKTAAVPDY